MTVRTKSRPDPVTRAEYEALLERIEEMEDALRMRTAEARGATSDALPAELVQRMISGEHPLRIWREHRGLTRAALAEKAGIQPGYLSEIENEKKPGSVDAFRRLAAALGVAVDDIVRLLRPFLQKGNFDPTRQAVRFFLSDGDGLVHFTITRAALEARFGLSAEAGGEETLKVFEANRDKIDKIAAQLFARGARRRNGYIVIDANDIQRL